MLVFVYGTLKRGYLNNHWLGDSQFVSEATTKPLYSMYHNGSYPCLVNDKENGKPITGELFEVSDPAILEDLDRLEGVRVGLYKREQIQLFSPEEMKEALGYIYLRSVDKLENCGVQWPPVSTGDFDVKSHRKAS